MSTLVSLRGDPVVRLTQKASTFVGISVDIFVYTPVCVFVLSDLTEIPPYRETGVAIPLSHCVSCSIADYRCYIPTSFRKMACRNLKTDLTRGLSQVKLASKAYRVIGGVARNSIANGAIIRSAKTDLVRFQWGFGEGLLKDKFAFFEAYKSPTPKRRKLLAKRPFSYKQKGPCLKTPLNWTGSILSLLI